MMLPLKVAPRRETLSEKESIACEQVRQKLLNTRKRMEDTLAGVTPDDDEEWYDTAEALAQPLLACYWSLWECGQPLCLSSFQYLPFLALMSALLQADLCFFFVPIYQPFSTPSFFPSYQTSPFSIPFLCPLSCRSLPHFILVSAPHLPQWHHDLLQHES